MKCPNCSYRNREGASFCHHCGAALAIPTSPPGSTGRTARSPSTKPLDQPSSRPSSPQVESSQKQQHATQPLPQASDVFAPLPEGALIYNGRYVILEVIGSDEQLNVYRVQDTVPVRLCPNCQTEISDTNEKFCSLCGADLSAIEIFYLNYLIHERVDGQAFAAEAQMLGMGVDHPGLLLPHAIFTEVPYGPPRHYLVAPDPAPSLATSLHVPQELNRVLEWGISLAQALEHLHSHQIVLRKISLNHIVVQNKKARWAHLNAASVIPSEARSKAVSYFTQDVQGLAAMLLFLATGQHQVNQTQLPEPVATTFAQALGAPAGVSAASFATALETTLQGLRRPDSVNLAIGRRTDVGQRRSLNEDSLLTLETTPVYRSISTPMGLFAVADGMGGHSAGDVASQLAIQAIEQRTIDEILSPVAAGGPLPDAHQWIASTIQAANRRVYEQRKAAGTDMGTTLVMALFVGNTATIANVGDSRAYLLSQDEIVQITTDHSLVERLVATGQITRVEAAHHPQKNVIYRVIGDKPQVQADLLEQQVAPGEALLLCSDGLSGMILDEQIWHIWRTGTSPQDACDRMVEAANEAGGEDNITVLIVQVIK